LIAVAAATLAGCTNDPREQLATPTFGQLHIPDPSRPGIWNGTSATAGEVVRLNPVPGRSVRIWFYASAGGTFSVALRELDGNPTALALTTGCGSMTPAAASGCYEVLTSNPPSDPAHQTLYSMHVSAPSGYALNYDIRVIDVAPPGGDRANSEAMVVKMRQLRNFVVNVTVIGSGLIESEPAGIRCGLANSGNTFSTCSATFGPGQIKLPAQPATLVSTSNRFRQWEGNDCPPLQQTCVITLYPIGLGPTVLVARFTDGAAGATITQSCKPAGLMEGWTFDAAPLAPASILGATVVCDAQGYVVCSLRPGGQTSTTPSRCAPTEMESPPMCATTGARLFIGGCYTPNRFP
jgi:hypothetical protein